MPANAMMICAPRPVGFLGWKVIEGIMETTELAKAITTAFFEVLDALPQRRIAYTLDEAAVLLGVTKRKLQGCIERREIRVKRMGKGFIVSHAELQRFLGDA